MSLRKNERLKYKLPAAAGEITFHAFHPKALNEMQLAGLLAKAQFINLPDPIRSVA